MIHDSRHVRAFRERHQKQGEQLVFSADGFIGELMGDGDSRQHNGSFIVTTERVAFYRKRRLAGEVLQTIPIADITSIELDSGLVLGKLTIHTPHDSLSVKLQARVLADANAAIEQVRDRIRGRVQAQTPAAALAPELTATSPDFVGLRLPESVLAAEGGAARNRKSNIKILKWSVMWFCAVFFGLVSVAWFQWMNETPEQEAARKARWAAQAAVEKHRASLSQAERDAEDAAAANAKNERESAEAAQKPAAPPAAAPTQASAASAPKAMLGKDDTCRAVAALFDAGSKLSDLQKESMWKQYEGKSFTWDLKVVEVSKAMFGGYTVQAKCAPRSDSLIEDILIEFDRNQEARVMRLIKGKTYSFNGKLTRYSNFMGLTAEDE